MKFNIANPATGCQKLIEISEERKIASLFDKRIAQEFPGENLGEEYKGYVFRITGGNDKQGFPMTQGVMLNHRVRLLMSKGASGYRPRRTGERKRKSARGCIVAGDIAVLSLVVVKQGENDIPGLTDEVVPKRLGPKRANKIRKFFNLSKDDDVRKYVIRREVKPKGDKPTYTKAPKIQRLITPVTLQRKRRQIAVKRRRQEASKEAEAAYKELLHKRLKEKKEQKDIAKRRRTSSMQKSSSA